MACLAHPRVVVSGHSVPNIHQTPVATCAQLQSGRVIPATLLQWASRHCHTLLQNAKNVSILLGPMAINL